jgi:hypothetical protein
MALLSAIVLLAAAPSAEAPNWHPRGGAEASARATVRIVSGARVKLGRSADAEPYIITRASVRLEDGTKHPANLVEFQ